VLRPLLEAGVPVPPASYGKVTSWIFLALARLLPYPLGPVAAADLLPLVQIAVSAHDAAAAVAGACPFRYRYNMLAPRCFIAVPVVGVTPARCSVRGSCPVCTVLLLSATASS
jgi:hypothetical protein